jgi:hypothetical protein
MHQSTLGERITAALSTVVAIALLGAALSAQQAQAPTADYLASLEADLRLQLDLAFRHDGGARRKQVAALEATLQAWRESAQSADDHELLVEWMQTAIRHTMPGAAGKLPPTPEFEEIPLPAAVEPAPALVDEPAPTPAEQPAPTQAPPAEIAAAPVSDAPGVTPIAVPPAVVVEPIADERPAIDEAVIEAPSAAGAPVPETPVAPVEHSITVPPVVGPVEAEDSDSGPAVVDASGEDEMPAAQIVDPVPPVVRINLAELNARILGYHQGLDEIEAALVADGEFSPERLAALVDHLEHLATQYQFVSLYYGALTADEQAATVAPRSIIDAVDLVAAQVAAASDGDPLEDFDAAHADRPTLAQRLQALADAVSDASNR